MEILIIGISLLISLEHFLFLYLEMFLWTKKLGRKIFGNTVEEAEKTKVLAANQGLYNGFLALGLLWGILYPNPIISHQILMFFLSCIFIAGVYGGFTAKRSIVYIQALPALIGLVLVF